MTAGKILFAAGVDVPTGRPVRRPGMELLIVEPVSLNGTGRTDNETPILVGTFTSPGTRTLR